VRLGLRCAPASAVLCIPRGRLPRVRVRLALGQRFRLRVLRVREAVRVRRPDVRASGMFRVA